MAAVLTALGTLAAIAVVGYLIGRSGLLGEDAPPVLARAVFTVAAPALLVVTIAHADLHLLLSRIAVVTWASTAVVALIALVVLRVVWRESAGDTALGVLACTYLNAGNLGLPVAVYLLGNAVAVVPTLLFQLLLLAPVAFAVLDADRSPRRIAASTLRNPVVLAAVVGGVLAALPWHLPEVVFEPFRMIGAAAAPLALIVFGMSLAAPREDGQRRFTREVTLAVTLRSAVHPLVAFGIGTALGLTGSAMLAVVTMAALPTAQNVLVYALRYERGQAVARDAGLVTTLLALPLMLVVAATLG